jgi:hypothetical protein
MAAAFVDLPLFDKTGMSKKKTIKSSYLMPIKTVGTLWTVNQVISRKQKRSVGLAAKKMLFSTH